VARFDADGYLYYVKRKPEKELITTGAGTARYGLPSIDGGRGE
jgi:hypothetical protein